MKVRVLVADDQAPFQRAAHSVLSNAPDFLWVGEATSGEQAVALAESLRPDVVLIDVKMPDVGGIEAARSITTAHPETMTVVLSTYRAEYLPATAHECGAAAYLHKSDFGERVLRELWDGHNANRPPRERE